MEVTAPRSGAPGRTALKILVIYDTRHGFTERCLSLLAADVDHEVVLWPVRSARGTPDWTAYGAVVFGGPVYFGRWPTALVRFLIRHSATLAATTNLAAFVVSLSPRAAALGYFSQGLPPVLKGKLGLVSCFGGAIQWKGLAWWERFIVKKARGIETDMGNLTLAEIQNLAAWLSAKGSQA